MSARPARPKVEVKHRFLAWDIPQFLVENTRKPETGDKTHLDSRNAKLSVTRSADRHTAAPRGRVAVEDSRLGKPQQRISKKLNNNSTHSTPVIIGDLWKPMQIRHSTTQVRVEQNHDSDSGFLGQQTSSYERYNTRRAAQQVLRNSRSTVYQLLRNHQERLSGARYYAKSADSSSTGPRYHGNSPSTVTDRIGEVAGYQIFGGKLPRTSVYNLNERIVSSATDLSSLSFGSIEQEVTDDDITAGLERVSESRNLRHHASNGGNLSLRRTDNVVDNGNKLLSMSNKSHTAEVTDNLRSRASTTKTSRFPVSRRSRQNFVGKTVDSIFPEEDDTYQSMRVGVRVPSSGSRSGGSGPNSPDSVDEIGVVGRENGIDESPRDCSLCPMCLAQAAVQAAESGDMNRSNEKLAEMEKDASLSRSDSSSASPDSAPNQETANSGLDAPPIGRADQIDESAERRNRLSKRLFSETPHYLPFSEILMVDSYAKNDEVSTGRPHKNPHNINHRDAAEVTMSQLDMKARTRDMKSPDSHSPRSRTEFAPKPRSGAITVKGSGMTRGKRLEHYRPSPLHASKWYVDAALPPRHQANPRGPGSPVGELPGKPPSSPYLSTGAIPTAKQRISLVVWKKMQQLETQPQQDNQMGYGGYGYRSGRLGAAAQYGGSEARFTGHQTQGNPGERLSSESQSTPFPLVVHIPTASFAPADADCPPNSP